MNQKKYAMFALFFLIFSVVSAGIYPRGKRKYYFQTSFSYMRANLLFLKSSPEKHVQLPRYVQDNTLQLYGEYGVSDKLTVSASLPIKLIKTESDYTQVEGFPRMLPSGQMTALSNASLSMDYLLWKKGKFMLSPKFQLNMPFSTIDSTTGLKSGYEAWGFQPQIGFGYYGGIFVELSAAMNFRTNDYSSQFISYFQIGGEVTKRFMTIAVLDVLLSSYNGNFQDGTNAYTGFYMNNTEFVGFGLKLGYKLNDRFEIWTSALGGFNNNQALKSASYNIAFAFKN